MTLGNITPDLLSHWLKTGLSCTLAVFQDHASCLSMLKGSLTFAVDCKVTYGSSLGLLVLKCSLKSKSEWDLVLRACS